MKKIKNLFLFALCTLASLSAYGQAGTRTKSAQEVIDILTANGGYCQTVYYSATYQEDDCTWYESVPVTDEHGSTIFPGIISHFTNNMWIKDSFGRAQFVDAHKTATAFSESEGEVEAKVVILKNAFGGLFDWDLLISDDYINFTYQPEEAKYPLIINPNIELGGEGRYSNQQYVHLQLMQADNAFTYHYNNGPARREDVSPSMFGPMSLQIWQAESDIQNFETIGVTPWGHTNFDYSLFVSPFWGSKVYFLRLSVMTKGVNGVEDTEDYHYDFYLAELRHYNPNTTIGDKLNGSNREFKAIANFDEVTKKFSIYNFSNFGPSFTQPLGNGNGYGEGLKATISPITGQLFSDGTLKIVRQPGYVHYNRGYESSDDPFDCKITKWDDCWTAGVVTDANGNYDPSDLQLKPEITGKWEGTMSFHHHADGVNAEKTNPWVTDGGTCRTHENIKLHIDPYVYSTDAQLAQNQYDTDDEHGRGGIYELVTAQVDGDITLQLAIDNENEKVLNSLMLTTDKTRLACPLEINVTANDQYVDHYELYVYEHQDNTNITDASDDIYTNESSLLREAMENSQLLTSINKADKDPEMTGNVSNYKTYKTSGTDSNGNPIYTDVPMIKLPNGKGDVIITFFVKAVYTEASGLAPTYHSLVNVKEEVERIVTGIEDVNVAGVKTVAGVYSINGQFMGTEVPAGNGIYVVRYTDGTATKIAVK